MTRFVFCHHAERADRRPAGEESEKYPGITIKGEKETREKARVLAEMVCDLSDGSVVILSGISRAVRTRSTLAVYADEFEKLLADKASIAVFNFANTYSLAQKRLMALKALSKEITNGGRRSGVTVIHLPLTVEQFVASPGDDEEKAGELMLEGLGELQKFFRRTFPKNPLCIVSVGHSIALNGLFHRVIKERRKEFSFI